MTLLIVDFIDDNQWTMFQILYRFGTRNPLLSNKSTPFSRLFILCIGYFGCIVQSLGDTLFGETCTNKKQLEVTQAPVSLNGDGMSGDGSTGDISDYGSGNFDIDIYEEESSGMPQNYVEPDYYENSGNAEAGNTDRDELLINFQDEDETRTRNNLEQLFS